MDEIVHEALNAGCLYNERRPFLRLLRFALESHGAFKVTAEVASWIQFIIENLMIDLLHKTGFVVEQVTKGHTEDKSGRPATAKRKAINGRDLDACVDGSAGLS